MAGYLSGPGVGLPYPQPLYPSTLWNGQSWIGSNEQTLAPGQEIPLARGRWMVWLGPYAVLQMLDPVTQMWRITATSMPSPLLVDSDGFNFRVANLTGCAVGAIVTAKGSGYAQATTTAMPASGNSEWQPIIGGAIGTSVSISAAGAGYGVAPLVLIPPPPPPGVQATAVAVISSGSVSSITVRNQGAGYVTAPSLTIVPNPTDPNYLAGTITSNATAVASLDSTATGALTAVLLTNNGAPFAAVPSLTIAGAGTSAAATIVPMWTTDHASIVSGGAGYSVPGAEIVTTGGYPSGTPTWTNPTTELTGYMPRQAQIAVAAAGGGTITTIGTVGDGGLFFSSPTALVIGGAPSTAATISLTVGTAPATVIVQQAG